MVLFYSFLSLFFFAVLSITRSYPKSIKSHSPSLSKTSTLTMKW